MKEMVSAKDASRRWAHRVLLVDDDRTDRAALARLLAARSALVVEAGSPEEAMSQLAGEAFDLVISEQRLPRGSGVEFLAQVRRTWPSVARVLKAGEDDPKIAWEAINRAGVCYLLRKPWDGRALDDVLAHGEASDAAFAAGSRERRQSESFPEIVGESLPMKRLFELVRKVARTDSTVLVLGETGTGKELIGRAIHEASPRRGRAFSAVNSAAFPESLLESELFGHRRGSFTGATENSKGLFEQADGGTVFLDEVAEMPVSMQAKLLRFLQTGEIRAVGSTSTHVVDVRLVAATNKPLEQEVERGTFREDLYYRLAVIPLEVPPLRARIEDVPLLARHFLRRVAERWGRPPLTIDDAALDALMAHHWPGNVRELENTIERVVALCPGDRVRVEDLPALACAERARAPEKTPESLPSLERRHILETLERVGGNRKLAAELLQISTTTLWRRLKEFGIDTRARGRHWAGGTGTN
jgi:DNA-binding NtrC family response regulator